MVPGTYIYRELSFTKYDRTSLQSHFAPEIHSLTSHLRACNRFWEPVTSVAQVYTIDSHLASSRIANLQLFTPSEESLS